MSSGLKLTQNYKIKVHKKQKNPPSKQDIPLTKGTSVNYKIFNTFTMNLKITWYGDT